MTMFICLTVKFKIERYQIAFVHQEYQRECRTNNWELGLAMRVSISEAPGNFALLKAGS